MLYHISLLLILLQYVYIYIYIYIYTQIYIRTGGPTGRVCQKQTQVYKQISPIVRKNMTHLFIYRLRNYGDLEAIVEELSAIYDKKPLLFQDNC